VNHLHRNGRRFPPNYLHDSWLDYLYWDTELEPLGRRRTIPVFRRAWLAGANAAS
jgi:hypothetical protein